MSSISEAGLRENTGKWVVLSADPFIPPQFFRTAGEAKQWFRENRGVDDTATMVQLPSVVYEVAIRNVDQLTQKEIKR